LSYGGTACLSFHVPAPTVVYPLSLHDALPICPARRTQSRTVPAQLRVDDARPEADDRDRFEDICPDGREVVAGEVEGEGVRHRQDRKSTRLNSSHVSISYAVFCLKKKTHKTSG